jgi:phosphoribosylformylglycinamidine synthase
LVSDADVGAITTGILYDREAVEQNRHLPSLGLGHAAGPEGVREAALKLLSSYNVSDKSSIYQHYDSEVQGRAVIRPGEADASVVVFIPGKKPGLAASIGGSSRLAAANPYLGGAWSVVEAVRNVVCVGATPLAVTDCLNYGDPEDPAVFHEFSEGVRGLGEACRSLRLDPDVDHGVPVVSGNVSFYNQSETGAAIPPTPIVACVGRIDDAAKAINMAFKRSGSVVAYLGVFHDRLGGSEYERFYRSPDPFDTPSPDFEMEIAVLRTILEGIEDGAVLAAHDVSHGGVVIAAAEMILSSRPYGVGCKLDFSSVLDTSKSCIHQLFGELGGILVEVAANEWPTFQESAAKHQAPCHRLGETSDDAVLWMETGEGNFALSPGELAAAQQGSVAGLLG